MMDGQEKSDRPVVPTKPANKAGRPVAESAEERGLAKRNPSQRDTERTQGRERVHSALARVRQVAERDKGVRFTALLHHVYAVDTLREAYFLLKHDAAAGIDGETWETFGEGLEERLQDLSGRVQRGAYRARPVRRVYIPKRDGRQRPLGIPVVEDKIVQRATVAVLEAIYEPDFLGFSYGFRPRRNQHQALEALDEGLMTKKVNWVLDADLRGFFDAIDHAWLVKFIEHRIGDRRVVRLIQKWLQAGVLEEGAWSRSVEGTPQGGSISPLLANIYLHYVFDQWVARWRRKQARGEVIVVRWADDFIVGFEHRRDAEAFVEGLRERLGRYGLELHPEKTRLLEFGRYAAERRRERSLPKPETFNFLGFTHVCGRGRNGRFTVVRRTMRQRMQSKLGEVKAELGRRLHEPIPEVGAWLQSVMNGHARYYGVAGNHRAVERFREAVVRQWYRALARRSQKARVSWSRMAHLVQRWLPPVTIHHPYARGAPGV